MNPDELLAQLEALAAYYKEVRKQCPIRPAHFSKLGISISSKMIDTSIIFSKKSQISDGQSLDSED